MARTKKVLRHIGWALLLIALISLETFIYLRETGLLEEFQLKDIFFKGGALDNYRVCDMRMTLMYLIMQIPRAMGLVWKERE